jgi:hypothetical protein
MLLSGLGKSMKRREMMARLRIVRHIDEVTD